MTVDITNEKGETLQLKVTRKEFERYGNTAFSPAYGSVYEDISLDICFDLYRDNIMAFLGYVMIPVKKVLPRYIVKNVDKNESDSSSHTDSTNWEYNRLPDVTPL